jgi:hypothetical protein
MQVSKLQPTFYQTCKYARRWNIGILMLQVIPNTTRDASRRGKLWLRHLLNLIKKGTLFELF